MALRLTLACADYDRTRALIDGRVEPEGIDLDVKIMRPREAFVRMLEKGEFDACEMSLSAHAILKARGDESFVGLPVMLSKMFRHSGMYVSAGARIAEPRDLIGKRIGTNRYSSTGLIAMRGLLQDEYGIAPSALNWCIGPLNDPAEKPQLPSNISDYEVAPSGTTLESLLERGGIDAIFSNDIPRLFVAGDACIARLFPNTAEAERDYYRRTGIFPVMHVVVLRSDIHRAHQKAAAQLYRAFVRAKDMALRHLYDSDAPHASLPFLIGNIEEARGLFGADYWAYGVEKNRPALAALCRHIHEQGFAPRLLAPEELFVPGLDRV
jgi:4,5-dihydroxyphthalate decarboxylase